MIKLSERTKKVVLILLTILLSILLIILSFIVINEFRKLDSKFKDFIMLVSLSIIGLVLFAVRDKPKMDKNYVDSLQVLILIIFPTIATISFFTDPIEKLILGTLPYFGTITGWYIFFVKKIYKKQELLNTNILNKVLLEKNALEKTKKTERSITVLWGVLLAYGITAVWLILQLT